jgi:hypothetical protein
MAGAIFISGEKVMSTLEIEAPMVEKPLVARNVAQ